MNNTGNNRNNHTNNSDSAESSSSNHNDTTEPIIMGVLNEKAPLDPSALSHPQEYHPLSFIPQNNNQGNHRKPSSRSPISSSSSSSSSSSMSSYHYDLETRKSIQNRLNSIYYTTSPTVATNESSTPMNLAALTRQHMTRASLMSNNGSTSSVASMIATAKTIKLPYSIHDYSSHSGSYHPQNVCVNQPTLQSSRWSSGSHDHQQYITIKFEKPVVAREFFIRSETFS